LVLTGRGVEQSIPALHSVGRHFVTIARDLREVADHILQAELNITAESDRLNFAYRE